ncbi:MAG: type II and III secretion system protein [Deltaproteobacteria bacterium]|nr:type II and III secretion system protein [Deltaproteobacteria bacterium]MBN2670054.1 type II and III secretion system protein [Deltaproteobacteria bacterium]
MKRPYRIVFCCLTACFLSLPTISPAMNGGDNEMLLVVGEQQVIDARNIESFSESTQGVIEVKIPKNGRQLVITALRPGTTSLLLLEHDASQKSLFITVFSKHPRTIIDEVKNLIGESPGVRFIQVGARVFVDGYVSSETELARIHQILSLYPEQVQSLVQVGSAVKPRTNIRLDLTFIELHAADNISGGINWPANIGQGGTGAFTYDVMTGMPQASYRVMNQAMPSIHAAQARGIAKIKKQAYLMTTSGNSATYQSGGEINIPIAGSQSAELRTVSYGCTLSVLPHVDAAQGLIDLQIEAEVSELKETDQKAPGRTLSKVSTQVHLGIGQTIVLSGLDSHTESRTQSGIPFLSRIPIVGMLFGVHQQHTEKVHGIIAITPVILDDPGRVGKSEIQKALKEFKQFKGF